MPRGSKILGKPIDETKWAEAKAQAAKEGHEGDYAYIMTIYKAKTHSGEFEQKHIDYRHKHDMRLDTFREKKWDSKHHKLKVAVKSLNDQPSPGMRLVVSKDQEDLDSFCCGSCGALLFKGMNLEKARVEVKCRRCGVLLVSDALVMIE